MNWNPKIVSDRELNSSNKTFAPPTGKVWKVVSIFVNLITTDTVSNRSLCVLAQKYNEDENDVVPYCKIPVNFDQEPSLDVKYFFSSNIDSMGSLLHEVLHTKLPEIYLFGNSFLQIYDLNGIDPTADDMYVEMVVLESDNS